MNAQEKHGKDIEKAQINLKSSNNQSSYLKKYWPYYFFILFEIGIILIYAFCVDYADWGTPKTASKNNDTANHKLQHTYPLFQDVHVMIFIGFGFLMTFLKHYSWSAVGLNFILGAWVIQIAIIFNRLWFMIAKNEWGKIQITVETLVDADFTAGSILIAFGGVLGKLNFMQYLIMATFQAFFYSIAFGLGLGYLGAVDVGGSMYIHTFGAYFGLAAALALKGKTKNFSKFGASYHSNLFAFIGTIFLWMFWPSFNSAPQSGAAQFRAIVNTYLSLTGSCFMVFVLSPFLKDGKLHPEYVLNATLAGGVMIGNSADLIFQPWAALFIGCCAGTLSIIGFHYFNAFLFEKIGLHDTCGIHYLHGMTGFIGGIIGAIFAGTAKVEELGDSLLILYPRRASISANLQACHQLAALAIVMGISLSSGFLTGLLLRLPIFCEIKTPFDDEEIWDTEEEHFKQDEEEHVRLNLNMQDMIQKSRSAVYACYTNDDKNKDAEKNGFYCNSETNRLRSGKDMVQHDIGNGKGDNFKIEMIDKEANDK